MTQYLQTGGVDERVALAGYGDLPGIVTNIEVRGQYQIEKKKREGISGSDKLGHGYNDAEVAITLEVLPPDEWGQIAQIEKAFKNAFGAAGKPKAVRITNPLLDSRDITSVLFQSFTTAQGNEDESLLCTINLVEYESLPRKQELKLKPKVVTGPQGLSTGEPGGGGGGANAATDQPPSVAESFAAGGGAGASRAKAEATAPMPGFLKEIAAGEGGLAQSFTGPEARQ